MSHVQFSFLLLCPILLSHLPCPISHSKALRKQLASSSSAEGYIDRRVQVALERYMGHLERGTLVHGPLLGWATVMGDALAPFRNKPDGEEYLMPRRLGVQVLHYPWNQHAADAVEGCRNFLRSLGLYTYTESSVQSV